MNDLPNENGFDLSTLKVKAEETPKFSLFPTLSAESPLRRLLGEFTPTYFQTSSIPMENMGAVNSANKNHQSAGQMAFNGRYLPKIKLKEFAGDPLEWQEWSGNLSLQLGEIQKPMMRK